MILGGCDEVRGTLADERETVGQKLPFLPRKAVRKGFKGLILRRLTKLSQVWRNCQLGDLLLACLIWVSDWQLAVGSWQLAVGSWQLAVGSGRSAIGGRQSAVGNQCSAGTRYTLDT